MSAARANAGRSSASVSVLLHAALAVVLVAAPRPGQRAAASRRAIALEVEVRPRAVAEAPAPPAPVPVTAPVEAAPPPAAPPAPRRAAVRPHPVRARAVAEQPPAALPAPAPAPSPEPTLEPTPAPAPGPPGPSRPLALFDRGALAAAIVAPAPARPTEAGTTTRGAVDTGTGDEGAAESVRALTEELREQAQAGRPEARGVVTYFHDARRRMASAWAPRTLHLPSRTKAMVQSMQAMNRAALEMMEGRSDRSRRAQEDGRITPDEWRDAMRDAALRARAVTSVIVAVVYDARGQVTDVRITRSSGHDDFDREVLAAARESVASEPAPPMPGDATANTPGGRVARYRFDVLMTAMPPVPPIAGVTFDESTGYFRVFYPGQINWRLNVVFLGARRGTEIRPESRQAVD